MILRIIFFTILLFNNNSVYSNPNKLIIASTTSVHDTGLIDYLNKEFNKEHNILIHVLALGTGQAIEMGKRGDADIILVHHEPSEIKFILDGYGIKRYNLMYNEFLIVGPKDDFYDCKNINSIF